MPDLIRHPEGGGLGTWIPAPYQVRGDVVQRHQSSISKKSNRPPRSRFSRARSAFSRTLASLLLRPAFRMAFSLVLPRNVGVVLEGMSGNLGKTLDYPCGMILEQVLQCCQRIEDSHTFRGDDGQNLRIGIQPPFRLQAFGFQPGGKPLKLRRLSNFKPPIEELNNPVF